MSRERIGMRENLQDILEFFSGKRLLTVSDVSRYTGLANRMVVKKMFPFTDNYISATTLAMCLAPKGDF